MKKNHGDHDDALNVPDMGARLRGSFSLSTSADDFEEVIFLPDPPRSANYCNYSHATDKTPLVPSTLRKKGSVQESSMIIVSRRNQLDQRDDKMSFSERKLRRKGFIQGSYEEMKSFFFGFMYEEACENDCFLSPQDRTDDLSRPLKLALCVSIMLTSASTTSPVILVPIIARKLLGRTSSSVSNFTSKAASSAVLGMSLGKFINGPLIDILGARRIAVIHAALLSLSLIFLSISWNESSTLWACFFIEFFQCVQWPGTIIIFASHSKGRVYEGGIYAASLSSKIGSLISIAVSLFISRHYSWRIVSAISSTWALLASVIVLVCVKDSPGKLHDPQNPISPATIKAYTSTLKGTTSLYQCVGALLSTCSFVIRENILPSLCSVFQNLTFWLVAIAHLGDAIVGSSQRVLGMYLHDTSGDALSEDKASSWAMILSIGTISGLAIAGNIFTAANSPRFRKQLIGRLYLLSITSCYLLVLFSTPTIQNVICDPNLLLSFQLICTFFMGFGVALPGCIPGIIGATFGRNKGLFSSYADGIAYGLSSLVWKVVGRAEDDGDSIGWAYCWATVALLVVICALVMIEFFEIYFVQGSEHATWEGKGYETIIFV